MNLIPKELLALALVVNSFYLAGHDNPAYAVDGQPMLNGEVTRTEIKPASDTAPPAGVAIEARNRPSIIIMNGSNADGLSSLDGLMDRLHFAKLTTEQYRDMKYGVIGIMVQQSFTEHLPVIVDLLPECPAVLAGLQKGDELIEANGHRFEPGEGQLEFMRVIDGEAGTNVDVTINREGKKVQYHLVRMNVEDIADDHVRVRYETILTLMKRSKRGITANP
ncbi:MAG: PDZ domain-containing protein [Candidatus Obscuribacterales bacterium]|nr:PDZ domain-containing protein [Candidatus Obscuribacterales bacterium]